MKVCLINNFPPYSGAGRNAYALWMMFKKIDKVKADLFCTHVIKKGELGWVENKGVNFLQKFAYFDHPNISRFLIYFVDRFRLPKGYDVYHITNQMLGFLVDYYRPNVVTLFDVLQFKYHDKLGNKFLDGIYGRLIRMSILRLKKADAVICVSEYTKCEAIKILSVDPKKISVVYSGVNHEIFKPYPKNRARDELKLAKSKKIVLHVGNELARKNVLGVVEALAILKKKYDLDDEVVLIRLGNKTSEIGNMLKKHRLNNKVIYRESFSEKEVAKYYSAADVMFFPSFEEGFGLPLVESMACGCPVITSNCGAMKEVVKDAAVLVDPNDTNQMAEELNKILNLKGEKRREMIKKSIKRAKCFSWQRFAEQTLEVYKKVVGN
ncbi:MAG: glycosyltransferase family 1 protein [Candidatus Shapirobacteria bacterium]|jgi:glycosyltransferase involved in cell wall biosynthesis